ncbi:MAG: nucleoside hydrolase [Polyangiaceae bacterium]
MRDILFDMETSDPDDFITLLLLLGHPRVNLVGVTITPGTPDQVAVVRRALAWFERDLPIGVFDLEHTPRGEPKPGRHGARGVCVSSWHYAAYGDMPPSRDAVPAPVLLRELATEDVTLVTGAPLKNLGAALALPGFQLGQVYVQGGFAGDGVVPPEDQLPKFRGRTTCPSFNLNGAPKAALAVSVAPSIGLRRFVSKNVCHGVVYDRALHEEVAARKAKSLSLELIHRGLGTYLDAPRSLDSRARESHDPEGKKLHDPLAACCAIDPSIGTWAEIELYRERGEWGARPSPGSRTQIITRYDRARFLEVFLAVG